VPPGAVLSDWLIADLLRGSTYERAEILDGLGHWWMVQDPARAARALASFWAGPGVGTLV
jgi:hypothetical protein